jgi:hypothetical protein
MSKVKRIFPGSTNGLINWLEENFLSIDQFVSTIKMKDGTTMTAYDTYTYLEAVGLAGITLDTIHVLSHDGEFTPKKRED